MGMRQVGAVADAIGEAQTSLVFTNTRSQCELWFRRCSKRGPNGPA
jgi:ATP-dependent Lhr-like helicase